MRHWAFLSFFPLWAQLVWAQLSSNWLNVLACLPTALHSVEPSFQQKSDEMWNTQFTLHFGFLSKEKLLYLFVCLSFKNGFFFRHLPSPSRLRAEWVWVSGIVIKVCWIWMWHCRCPWQCTHSSQAIDWRWSFPLFRSHTLFVFANSLTFTVAFFTSEFWLKKQGLTEHWKYFKGEGEKEASGNNVPLAAAVLKYFLPQPAFLSSNQICRTSLKIECSLVTWN